MSALFLIWLACTSIVWRATVYDIESENPTPKTVILFKHDHENYYKYYDVKVKPEDK